MPEYRRFIAYFYEYIDEKKQKNAGFAKVELRNGMWRILFRVAADVIPDGPIQVYGFVRESGYLLGFPLGTLQTGREIAEEWAYRAEALIGHETYRFADLSGIWIQSGDDRHFITVWDDEALDPGKFVLELPEREAAAETDSEEEPLSAIIEVAQEERPMEAVSEVPASVTIEEVQEEKQMEAVSESVPASGAIEEVQEEIQVEADSEAVSAPQKARGAESTRMIHQANIEQELPPQSPQPLIEDIFRKRKGFSPFQDDEISGCVQLQPCDVARLQQASWKVGRSSFLQHGFYQYRHLLLGRRKDGSYVIGVPGIRNPQEKYMAELFGYDRFKTARLCECGKSFGYWYRTLSQ